MERSILKLPLSKLCAVSFALQNRAPFEGEKRAKKVKAGQKTLVEGGKEGQGEGQEEERNEERPSSFLQGRTNHEVHIVN